MRGSAILVALIGGIVAVVVPGVLGQRNGIVAEKAYSADGSFVKQVAPLLAKHCLECHGPSSKKGKLDLSRKSAAFAGGKNGPALVPGKSAESPVWEHVEAGRMPPRSRPPLSAEEKKTLRAWIESGAVWPDEVADVSHFVKDRNAGSAWVRRLTVPEYVQTVRCAVGVNVEQDARNLLPRDLRADGFSNTAYNLNVDLGHVEAYAKLAEIVVRRMDVPAFAAKFSRSRDLSEAHLRKFIADSGKWLLRGPPADHEADSFLQVAKAVQKEGGDFHEIVSYVVEAMLQSPRFIYRIENQSTPYALASRLSYVLLGEPPDEQLLHATESGELGDRRKIEAQVQRLLGKPQAVQRSLQFISEWMDLDRMETLRPDPKRFAKWDPQLAADMRSETLAFFEDVVWKQKRPLPDLMNAKVTFLTPRLADHYGLNRNLAVQSKDGKPADLAGRVSRDLQLLYVFNEGSGSVVRDRSGAGEPLDLKIENPSAVRWGNAGMLVNSPTLLRTGQPPRRLIEAIKKTNALTLEAWITPSDVRQRGPARILSLSAGPSDRNFTLGQEDIRYDVRLRQRGSDNNGLPSLESPTGLVVQRPTHVVFTRDASGKARIFIDGEEKAARDRGGDLSNWDNGFQLVLANETSKDRPWKGTYHLVAIYNRALTLDEIRANGQGLSRFDLSSVPGRGGLLTQASVLTVGGDDASMVTRGLFVLRELLYSGVDDPPPCVDTTPIPTKPGMSQRAVSMQRINNKACSSCHSRFETIAFGLEKFDGIGARNDVDEHGNKLRDDGEILFPDQDKPTPFRSSDELMNLLAKSDRVSRAITRKVTQFALGRPLTVSDEPIVEQIHQTARKNGGTYSSLMTAIVLSDLVQKLPAEDGSKK